MSPRCYAQRRHFAYSKMAISLRKGLNYDLLTVVINLFYIVLSIRRHGEFFLGSSKRISQPSAVTWTGSRSPLKLDEVPCIQIYIWSCTVEWMIYDPIGSFSGVPW
ncbi:hypothetical protein NPIL_143931 [Nephila pilipes]|uniref:Uncharacterized protein n=1 Tax=Nephila pilipes TaxID=299642 RepID=A0A8X6MPH7_NEPPI|nr:hypothetical protein NPIL_143931 [Nephila pilipes]